MALAAHNNITTDLNSRKSSTDTEERIEIPYVDIFSNLSEKLLGIISAQWKNTSKCDVRIVTNDGRTYHAHKAVLSACSQYLENALESLEVYGSQSDTEAEIYLEMVSSKTCEILLDLLYTSKLTLKKSNAAEVLLAAEILDLQSVSAICRQFLRSGVVTKPVTKTYDSAVDINEKCNDEYSSDATAERGFRKRKIYQRMDSQESLQSSSGISSVGSFDNNKASLDFEISDKEESLNTQQHCHLDVSKTDVNSDSCRSLSAANSISKPIFSFCTSKCEGKPTSVKNHDSASSDSSTHVSLMEISNDNSGTASCKKELIIRQNDHQDIESLKEEKILQSAFKKYRSSSLNDDISQCNYIKENTYPSSTEKCRQEKPFMGTSGVCTDFKSKTICPLWNSISGQVDASLWRSLYLLQPNVLVPPETIKSPLRFPGNRQSTLNGHPQHHSTQEKYILSQCQHCRLGFTSEWALAMHYQIFHTPSNFLKSANMSMLTGYENEKRNNRLVEKDERNSFAEGMTILKKIPDGLNMTKYSSNYGSYPKELFGLLNQENKKTTHTCYNCKKEFDSIFQLRKHRSSEHVKRPFSCHRCDAAFPNKAGLAVHLRSHTGERPYRCKICNKAFTQLGHVQRHQKVHTGEKPYQCPICQARVRDKASMHYHLLAHQGVKPYQCDQCDAKFTKRSSLVKHKNVHTGSFLYRCPQCKASFREKASLSRHVRSQHKDPIYATTQENQTKDKTTKFHSPLLGLQ